MKHPARTESALPMPILMKLMPLNPARARGIPHTSDDLAGACRRDDATTVAQGPGRNCGGSLAASISCGRGLIVGFLRDLRWEAQPA